MAPEELFYETHIFCCVNERPHGHPRGCCAARGANGLREYMKTRGKQLGIGGLRVNNAGCLDRCELGPTLVIYPEGVWYTCETEADVDEILERHVMRGERVARLLLEVDQRVPRPRPRAVLEMRVTAVEARSAAIKRFELQPVDGAALPAWQAGAHIDVLTGAGLRRSYSLAGDPSDRSRLVLGVLREAESRGGSAWMCESVAVGDVLRVTPPLNNFRLADGAARHLLIAGGIGITPMLAMCHELRARGADFALHYCARSPEHAAFANDVRELCGDRATFHYDGGDPSRGLDVRALLAPRAEGTHVYVCGPQGLMDAARAAAAGWPEDSVHFELFAPPPRSARSADDRPFDIVLSRRKQTLTVPADKTILQVVREHGVDMDSSCEEGICSTCRVRLLGGRADHRDGVLSAAERAAQRAIMICTSRAEPGETLILDL